MIHPPYSELRPQSVNPEKARRFWQGYQACVEAQRVSPYHSPHYVRWARDFVDFLPGQRLRDRQAKDIEAYLRSLGDRDGIQPWQVKQAEAALRILYEDFLPQHARWGTVEAGQDGEAGPGGGQAFRDRVVPGEADRRCGAVLETLRLDIRNRHQSYRTEKTYLGWVRRFLAFHRYADPAGMDSAKAIKRLKTAISEELEALGGLSRDELLAQRRDLLLGQLPYLGVVI